MIYKNLNTLKIKDNTYLFFDIFYKENKIYMILPIYNEPIDSNSINLKINNQLIKVSDIKIKDSDEPTLIFIYNYESLNKEIDVLIEYDNIIKTFKLTKINILNKHKLGLTTLFKGDYYLFPLFYEYYTKQGIEHFYMYYNGILTKKIIDIFNLDNVTLIEWNFEYWNIDCKYKHHAQLGQIHHAIYYYGKDICDYMIFCDLDEYLFIPNNSIIEFILNNTNYDTIGFCNYWSKTLDNKIPSTFPNEFLSSDKNEYRNRSKNIHKIQSINTINIHRKYSYTIKNPKIICNFIMFHFYSWSDKKRKPKSLDTSIIYKHIISDNFVLESSKLIE